MGGDDIFLIDESGLTPMSVQPYENESLLQDLLADYPDLLAGGQISPSMPRRWLLITRETGVPRETAGGAQWSLDHLFLDQAAVPTIVEVKRSTDTRIRREVVGQMLDYAANGVRYWPPEELRTRLSSRLGDPDEADQAVESLADGDLTADEYWQRVAEHLYSGRVRMIFVADVIPHELRRVIEFLNEQMAPAEVLGVEVKQYAGAGRSALVPNVVGATAAARQVKNVQTSKPFDELLEEAPPQVRELDERLRHFANEYGYSHTTSRAARKILLWDSNALLLLYPAWGSVEINVKRLREQGDEQKADQIQSTLEGIAGHTLARQFPGLKVDEVLPHFDQFTASVLQPYAAAFERPAEQ